MRILVITSCTGLKAPIRGLLVRGDYKAEDLYVGLQHMKLMEGVSAFRARFPGVIDLKILSAKYGLIDGNVEIGHYNYTLKHKTVDELDRVSKELKVPQVMKVCLESEYDLAFCLLGPLHTSLTRLGGSGITDCYEKAPSQKTQQQR